MRPISEQTFCVKALASDLGRHVNYVYAMTARGFEGKSVAEAREWIETHGFVIVRGRPKVKKTEAGG